jgi:hypothetical protein
MRLTILLIGITTVILQSCGNFNNFNNQKYTKLRFNKSNITNSDHLPIQNDSIIYSDETEITCTLSEICIEEIIPFHHKENSQRIIHEQRFEMEEPSSLNNTKSSDSKLSSKKNVTKKKQRVKTEKEGFGWLLYILGAALVLSGVLAPLFAALIGWWMILIGVAAIFLGTGLMLEGSKKIVSYCEELGWSAVFAFFIGLICFGTTSIIGIILMVL